MSDARRAMLFAMDINDLVDRIETLENANAEISEKARGAEKALRDLVAYLDMGDLRGNQYTEILETARKIGRR